MTELRHLRYFIAVAEELNFGRAAARLHISQPPLSQQIQALEQDVGVKLFERDKRRVVLTEAGKQFLTHCYSVLEKFNDALSVARRAGRGETGMLRIGFTGSLPFMNIMPKIIRDFRETYPSVELRLEELASMDQVEMLQKGSLDICFTRRLPTMPPLNVDAFPLVKESLVVALPAWHALAKKKTITMPMLANEKFVMYARPLGTGLYDQIMSLCVNAGFTPKVAQEARHMPTIIGLVSAGVGISLVSPAMQQMKVANVVYRTLKASGAITEVLLVCRRNEQSVLVNNFMRMARTTRQT